MSGSVARWLLIAVFACLAYGAKWLETALANCNETKLEEKDLPAVTQLLAHMDRAENALQMVVSFHLCAMAVFCAQLLSRHIVMGLLSALAVSGIFGIILAIPKTLGTWYADDAVCKMAGLIVFLDKLLRPATFISEKLSGMLGNPPHEEVTEEEIREMVDIGEQSGTIEGDERDMIENVFDFGDRTAADCMTHRTDVTALWISDSESTIESTIEQTGLSRFPVYDEDIDDIKGVLFARDFLLNLGKREGKKPLTALLREPYFVPETVKADTLLKNMQRAKTHIAIVVDEYGGVSGLVTMEDLLEEIVGDIYDEYDPQAEAEIKQVSENVWRVDGSVTLDTLDEALGITLPESEDYDTLGGLFLSRFSEIPEDGTTPETDVYVTEDLTCPEDQSCDVLHIKVEKLLDRRVEQALIEKSRYTPVTPQEDSKED